MVDVALAGPGQGPRQKPEQGPGQKPGQGPGQWSGQTPGQGLAAGELADGVGGGVSVNRRDAQRSELDGRAGRPPVSRTHFAPCAQTLLKAIGAHKQATPREDLRQPARHFELQTKEETNKRK